MQIIIQDDIYKDVIRWRSLPKSYLPKFGLDKDSSIYKDCGPNSFILMVEPDDSIAAVKAYIQEEKGISFKKQKLLNEEGVVLRDAQTLVSLGIKKGSTLILHYALVTQLVMTLKHTGRKISVLVEPDDTIGDIKAKLQEKEGMRFHQQSLLYQGQDMPDDERLINLDL